MTLKNYPVCFQLCQSHDANFINDVQEWDILKWLVIKIFNYRQDLKKNFCTRATSQHTRYIDIFNEKCRVSQLIWKRLFVYSFNNKEDIITILSGVLLCFLDEMISKEELEMNTINVKQCWANTIHISKCSRQLIWYNWSIYGAFPIFSTMPSHCTQNKVNLLKMPIKQACCF